MAHFNEYLNFLELSPLIKHFLQNGKKRLYKKGEFFCQASEVCHNIAYISQGGFRYFYLDTEEDKHIIGYSFEKDFVVELLNECGVIPYDRQGKPMFSSKT